MTKLNTSLIKLRGDLKAAMDKIIGDIQKRVEKAPGMQLSEESYTSEEKGKLEGIQAGAQVNVGTDLTYSPGDKSIRSSTGSKASIPSAGIDSEGLVKLNNTLTSGSVSEALTAAQGKVLKGLIDNINTLLVSDDASLDELQEIVDFIKMNREELDLLGINSIAGLQNALDSKQPLSEILSETTASFTLGMKDKLDGVQKNATANATDAHLKNRANHTGSQAISTVTGLQTALDNKVDTETGMGLSQNSFTNAEKTKLSGIATGATANATNAQLRERSSHTGTQPINTVSGLQSALNSKLGKSARAADSEKLGGTPAQEFITVNDSLDLGEVE